MPRSLIDRGPRASGRKGLALQNAELRSHRELQPDELVKPRTAVAELRTLITPSQGTHQP